MTEPTTAACPECAGTGTIVVEFHHAVQEQDCVECDGTGVRRG